MERNNLQFDVKIGTSGYSYEDWRDNFYPSDIPKAGMLEFYSWFFNTVEINSSYYRIPNHHVFQRMAEKTPPDFEFIVKVNQETTHRRLENKQAINQLIEALKPMMECQKLHGLLAQFPYSFRNTEANRRYLSETKRFVGDIPLFVEFRNDSWLKPALIPFLRENGMCYVNVDQPGLKGLLPPQDVVTNPPGYIRFHGRNAAKWWDGQGSERYDYEYTKNELLEWLDNISRILKKAPKTYIFFNNHPQGKAIKNARDMMEILSSQLGIRFDTRAIM
ncbi:MAG TPA: DUF72 domain-containing protein [Caldithrix abyssi]|uniref:DUF72 domain-containing protein n=1 Tax=Caldithrix abyssi TaxID=187145 RepID=A0A7V4U195_CALAY|nr:DUF72 domain-containing protein [Caldithrix abyssi]